jgi:hypothetical protein
MMTALPPAATTSAAVRIFSDPAAMRLWFAGRSRA